MLIDISLPLHHFDNASRSFCRSSSVSAINAKSLAYRSMFSEALPGVLGNRGTRAFISGEQGNKGQFFRGTGEQRQYWGTGNIENKFSIFRDQGSNPIYFRGTREQVPPPPLGGPLLCTRHTVHVNFEPRSVYSPVRSQFVLRSIRT